MSQHSPSSWDALFAAVGQRSDNDAAWSDLYASLWPYLTDWVVSRYGLDAATTGDVVQDAFLQYRSKLIAGRIGRPSLAHVRAFVRLTVLTALKAQSRLAPLDDLVAEVTQPDPERALMLRLMVDQALDRLEPRCTYVLRQRYYHGFTSAEIAERLGLETGNVDVLLHRCRARCREILSAT